MNKVVACPFDKSHLMLRSRLEGHIVKCSKKYPDHATCVYNATHRVHKEMMLDHLMNCESRKALEELRVAREYEKKNQLRGAVIHVDRSHEDKIVSNEYWD